MSIAGTQTSIFSAGPTLVPRRPCARTACTASPCASALLCLTWLTSACGNVTPGRVDADAIAEIDEAAALVQREHVPDAIGQALGDIARIVAKVLQVSVERQPPKRSWSDCGRSQ